ncbi:MAG: hypothetical protein IPJ19_11835 [Planctomycetes bacterium]|nr:hypothetical protein [Planctomycetota bacterium]
MRICNTHVVILGVTIVLGRSRCATGFTHVAAHFECQGESNPGTDCEETGSVAIEFYRCQCTPHLGHWLEYTSCECQLAGTIGTIATGQTFQCP